MIELFFHVVLTFAALGALALVAFKFGRFVEREISQSESGDDAGEFIRQLQNAINSAKYVAIHIAANGEQQSIVNVVSESAVHGIEFHSKPVFTTNAGIFGAVSTLLENAAMQNDHADRAAGKLQAAAVHPGEIRSTIVNADSNSTAAGGMPDSCR